MKHFLALLMLLSCSSSAETVGHACDGSAIVSVGAGFFLNATDEDNTIRLYKIHAASHPVREFVLNAFLQPEVDKKGRPKEVDIEAVAAIRSRLYWIGSHGRDKKGNPEPSRHRLFATDLTGTGAATQLTPAGKPFAGLIAALSKSDSSFARALRAAEPLPHQQGGIDIEGIAVGANGSLLIGFRSPLLDGKAVIVPLRNPAEVVTGKAGPQFGDVITLDLGGLGIRDLAATARPDEFWLLAGPPGVGTAFRLYRWQLGQPPAVKPATLPTTSGAPEGVLVDAVSSKLFISIDGGEQGAPACKDRPVERRTFQLIPQE